MMSRNTEKYPLNDFPNILKSKSNPFSDDEKKKKTFRFN